MKRYFLYPFLALISLVIIPVLILALVLFFKPNLIINTKTLKFSLEKTEILKSWSWDEAHLDFEWNKWNDRIFSGDFRNFCIEYQSEGADLSSCFQEISWKLNLIYEFGEGFQVKSPKPFIVRSDELTIVSKEAPKKEEKTTPPDIWGYWNLLWGPLIPDIDINMKKIKIASEEKPFEFDFSLKKDTNSLIAHTMEFELKADPEKFVVLAPPQYKLPFEVFKGSPLYLRNFELSAPVKSSGINFHATGAVEVLEFLVDAKLKLPIKNDLSSVEFKKKFLQTVTAKIELKNLQENYKKFGPKRFGVLPAPLNVMEGSIVTDIKTKDIEASNSVLIKAVTNFSLKSKKQALDLIVNADVPLNVNDFSPGSIVVDVNFNKVIIQLPRLSKKSAPPQLAPDGRIQKTSEIVKKDKEEKKEELDLTLQLEALNEKALHFKTNLLDEPLRLNFDLFIKKGNLENGYIQALPLKTEIFKRPIHLEAMRINFSFPKDPVMKGTIQFPLPEYKISLNLEGPVSDPRYSFSSVPPLPQNDIYAVLLFGRPLADLGPEDKNAAQKTNQILSQGILSLSVLYFLAGSPVEYVGYDPDSKSATAQIGLGSKSSLRVGGGQGGTSTGVRRSLGKGWYLDTSTQSSSSLSDSNNRSYGVMLERIIAY